MQFLINDKQTITMSKAGSWVFIVWNIYKINNLPINLVGRYYNLLLCNKLTLCLGTS